MSVAIVGIGTWLPEHVKYNDAWPAGFGAGIEPQSGDRTFNDIPVSDDPISAEIVARDLLIEAKDPFLGAKRRHVADASATTYEVEALAAKSALADAGIAASEVDLVLVHSVVPERMVLPSAAGVAYRIGAHRALGLGAEATCASTLVQLDIACAYLESGRADVVLATQSHLLLRAFAPDHPALPGLGDAASALVLTRSDTGFAVRSTFAVSHGEFAHAVTYVRGNEPGTDPPWWQAGPAYRLGSRAPEQAKFLMRETVSYGAATVREAAARANIDLERIDVLASVQPRGFIPPAIAERLGLPRERAVTTYDEIAHVGACGPVFNLERARARKLLPTGSLAALYAQGAGFTRAAVIVEAS